MPMPKVTSLVAAVCVAGVPAAPAQHPSLDALTRVRPEVRSARFSSAAVEDWSNADNRWVKPGDTLTLAGIDGPGVIRHIWLTFADAAPSWISRDGSANPSEIVLRMYWDDGIDADLPAVESPLGDFFACGFGGRAEVNSIPVQVQGAGGESYNCYWPMPFLRRAKITITNESPRPLAALYFQIDYTREPLPDDTAYFCAQYRQEFPAQSGRDYLVADIEAPAGGHYVGTVMSVRSRSPQWFGEGDDKFFIDGEPAPSIRGTGTEDYFLNAWGMERATFPCFGVSRLDGWLGDLGDTGTMYRWHIHDPVFFSRSLRFEIEHKGWMSADETTTGKVEGHVERNDDFATVAFWYQRGQPRRFTTLPAAAERVLPPIDLVVEGKDLLARAASHDGSLSLQPGGFTTGDGQLFLDGQRVGSAVEFSFDVPDDRPRHLVLPITHSYDFGVYRLVLDGTAAGDPIDCYSPRIEVRQHRLGETPITPGTHTLRLECVGINPNSAGFKLGIDGLRLRERWNVKRPPLGPPRP